MTGPGAHGPHAHALAGRLDGPKLPEDPEERKCFREGGPDPREAGGAGLRQTPGCMGPQGSLRGWGRDPQGLVVTPRPRAGPGPSPPHLGLATVTHSSKEPPPHLKAFLGCVFYLIFQRTHSFIIPNRESELRRNGFLSIRPGVALSNCL